MVSNLSIAAACLRTVVLAEGGLLGWIVIRVVANHVTNQQSVGQTVWNVELRAQFMRHGVTHAEEGVGKSDTGNGRRIVNTLTRHRIFRAVTVAGRQILFQQLQCLQRLTVRVFVGQYRYIGFQRMGDGIQTPKAHSERGISITRLASTIAISGVRA